MDLEITSEASSAVLGDVIDTCFPLSTASKQPTELQTLAECVDTTVRLPSKTLGLYTKR